MRTTGMLSVTLTFAMLALLPAAGAAENLLRNGGFEEEPGMCRAPGWTPDGIEGFGTFADYAHSGRYSYKTWWQPALWQDLKTKPGEKWTVTAWFMNAPEKGEDQPLTGDAIGRIRLEFKDRDNVTIQAVHSETIDASTKPGKWIKLTVTAVAPFGCTTLRVVINRVQQEGSGVFYVDDVKATH